MSNVYKKPLPAIRPWTEKFWKAARNGELLLQKGKTSGKYIMYPRKYSPYDYNEEIEWVKASGKGTIYSYSIVHNNPPSFLVDDLPFAVAIIDLEEGVRMCTRIVNTDFNSIHCGAKVEAVFEPVTDDIGLVNFKVV